MSTIAPERITLPIEDGPQWSRASANRPFGLTLCQPTAGSVPVLDLTDAHLDPVTQTLVGADGVTYARRTSSKTTTHYTTQYDHSRFSDTKDDVATD